MSPSQSNCVERLTEGTECTTEERCFGQIITGRWLGNFFYCIQCMGENLRAVLHPLVFSRLSMHMIDVASPFPSVAAFASLLTPI